MLQRQQDLLVRRIFLVPELVAGEGEDLQPAGPVPLLQVVQLQEVAGRGASERRHVDHQQHLSPQRAERQRLRRAQRPRRHGPEPRRASPLSCSCRRHGEHCRRAGPPPASRSPPLRPGPPRTAQPRVRGVQPRGTSAFDSPSRAGWEFCSSVHSSNRRPRALHREAPPVLRNCVKSAQHIVPGSTRLSGIKPPGTEAAPGSSRGLPAGTRRRNGRTKRGHEFPFANFPPLL